MSKFYGTVGDPWSNRTNATRCGHRGIRSSAQSYDGSVIVELEYDNQGALCVTVRCDDGSSSCYGDTVYRGTFDDFKLDLLTAYVNRVNN